MARLVEVNGENMVDGVSGAREGAVVRVGSKGLLGKLGASTEESRGRPEGKPSEGFRRVGRALLPKGRTGSDGRGRTQTRGNGTPNRGGRGADLNRTFGDHPNGRLPGTRVSESVPSQLRDTTWCLTSSSASLPTPGTAQRRTAARKRAERCRSYGALMAQHGVHAAGSVPSGHHP